MTVKLHFEEKGSGSPLILLHGNGDTHEFFENQIDYFAAKYRVIAVDTRGHGKSPRGMLPFTIKQFAEDLKTFMDSNNIENADILGFSDGGNIALVFTLSYPQYVGRLILNGANIYPSGLKAGFLLPVRALYAFSSAAARFSKKARCRKELLALMIKEPDISPGELKGIKSPTLVIAGTNDLIKNRHTRLIAEAIPDSVLCFIKGDHSVARKNSIDFNKAVDDFLKK